MIPYCTESYYSILLSTILEKAVFRKTRIIGDASTIHLK